MKITKQRLKQIIQEELESAISEAGFGFFNKAIFKEWYFKKGLILIDIFLIIALIQYFIFDGSFNEMILWLKGVFQFYF